jgi:hypothetical protein
MTVRTRVATILVAAVAVLVTSAGVAAAQTFTVTPFDSTAYVIDQQNNPTLTLTRGQTYTFNVNASGHPFWIKTARGAGSVNHYDNGVTNNGDDVGTVTFTVPLDAPNPLFYNCGVHPPMGGTINIVAESTPTSTATRSPTPTASQTRTPTPSASPTATPTADVSATPTASPIIGCAGNCNGDGSVTVDELVVLVNIEGGSAAECPDGIPDGSTVDGPFLVTALANALAQCGTGG